MLKKTILETDNSKRGTSDHGTTLSKDNSDEKQQLEIDMKTHVTAKSMPHTNTNTHTHTRRHTTSNANTSTLTNINTK